MMLHKVFRFEGMVPRELTTGNCQRLLFGIRGTLKLPTNFRQERHKDKDGTSHEINRTTRTS